jgi:hypothetical protein
VLVVAGGDLIGVEQRAWSDVVGLAGRDHAASGDVTAVDWCSAVGVWSSMVPAVS